MSSAGRAASLSGCVARPMGRETGLTGYAEQIQRSLPTGGSAMETAEHREPYESRGSRTDLGAPGGASPPADSTRPAGYQRPAGRRLNSANAPFEGRPLNRGVGWEASSRAAGRNCPKLYLDRRFFPEAGVSEGRPAIHPNPGQRGPSGVAERPDCAACSLAFVRKSEYLRSYIPQRVIEPIRDQMVASLRRT